MWDMYNDVLVKFGKNLKKIRIKKGLSQERLALKAGLDRTYVGSVERGERNISLLNIEKIAKALDKNISDFLKLL
jgi:transcriptional regulator with XRE-family HTH domain